MMFYRIIHDLKEEEEGRRRRKKRKKKKKKKRRRRRRRRRRGGEEEEEWVMMLLGMCIVKSQWVIMLTYHGITMHNDVAMNIFFF